MIDVLLEVAGWVVQAAIGWLAVTLDLGGSWDTGGHV